MASIYKIYDINDKHFNQFYCDIDGIIDYLEEQQENIEGYNEKDDWTKNLERYGLRFEQVYNTDEIENDIYKCLAKYKKGFNILMDYWDSFSSEQQWDIGTQLKEIGL